MIDSQPADRFGATAQAFHWSMAILIIGLYIVGSTMDAFPRNSGGRAFMMTLHMSLGVTVIIVLVFRVLSRLRRPAPSMAASAWWERAGAGAVHFALYALMLAIPLSGMLTYWARGRGIPMFGLFEIPTPFEQDQALGKRFEGIHELLANLILYLAGAHALAALWHHFYRRDAVLLGMLPRRFGAGLKRLRGRGQR